MRIDADLNEVKDIEVLPGGLYEAQISQEPKFVESSKQKTPGLEFVFKLLDPATEISPGVQRTLRHTIYKSKDYGWQHFKMKEICEACSVTLDNPDTEEFVGAVLKLAISQETFKHNGEDKVKNVIDHFVKA